MNNNHHQQTGRQTSTRLLLGLTASFLALTAFNIHEVKAATSISQSSQLTTATKNVQPALQADDAVATPVASLTGADVTVHYEDEFGKQLAPNVVFSGNVGNGYISETKEFPGYQLKIRPQNATGFFSTMPQELTYVYTNRHQVSRKLMHNAYIYDINHQRVDQTMLLAYTPINIYPGQIGLKDGKMAYEIGDNRYVMAGNIDGTVRDIWHNAYVYRASAKRADKRDLLRDLEVRTYGSPYQFKDGKFYYRIGGPRLQYVKTNNLDGLERTLKHNAHIYRTGKKLAAKQVLPKGQQLTTYGGSYIFKNGQRYYRISGPQKRYVKFNAFHTLNN